ncbi:putative tricarboxylate transport protein, mitochondrial [Halyomorpha halys]|uniref:putative tricarboxylate transport protein, mitochondrial n=1 Tax=Halyomorpha halys TaxID=286706 RepID=UPI0006D4E7CE|nr:putative tricarboxylate transport protein, mitochondrial [Halyomorpha halys]
MNSKELQAGFNNPFLNRPWMTESGAAATEEKKPAAPEDKKKGLKGIIAGGLTGAIECLITFPTEYVKTHLQLDEKHGKKEYDGIIDCVKKTIKRDGIFGLYRGMSPLLLGSIPKSGTRFGGFEIFKSYMVDEKGNLRPRDRAMCGLGAGVLEAIVAVTPMETIKVKFIHDKRMPNPKYKGLFHGVTTIVREEGLRGLYQGVTATVMKQGSNQAIRFFVMETLKDWYKRGDNSVSVPKPVVGAFGAIAGAASVFGNTPLDVVKTRMQGREAAKYKNTFDCIGQILKNEGITAFYKGTIPRLTRVCLDVAISFVIFESFMDLFHRLWR